MQYESQYLHEGTTFEHHGVKGMKWGVRRYQNDDGTYTKAGQKRYALDRDVNDTSRTNVAKIRLGEARRRLDTAKKNGKSYHQIADLQRRVRTAKRTTFDAKIYDKGAKLASKGQTINRNTAKTAAGWAATSLATYGMENF